MLFRYYVLSIFSAWNLTKSKKSLFHLTVIALSKCIFLGCSPRQSSGDEIQSLLGSIRVNRVESIRTRAVYFRGGNQQTRRSRSSSRLSNPLLY